MGETTNKLLGMAKKVGAEIPKRELDVLLATGEQQTVALLAIALQNLGIEAQSMTGFQSGFVTNKYHTNAKIKEINTEKVEEIVNSGKVAVVAGFQGIDEEGDIINRIFAAEPFNEVLDLDHFYCPFANHGFSSLH